MRGQLASPRPFPVPAGDRLPEIDLTRGQQSPQAALQPPLARLPERV